MPRTPGSNASGRLAAAGLVLVACCAGTTLAGSAAADARLRSALPARHDVEASFERFALAWMEETRRLSAADPDAPGSGGSADPPANPYSIEIRATGDATVPYLGLLRYVEVQQACAAVAKAPCRRTSTAVTEIFRFEGGRWVY